MNENKHWQDRLYKILNGVYPDTKIETEKLISQLLKEQRNELHKLIVKSNDLILQVVDKAKMEIFDVDLAMENFSKINGNLKKMSDILKPEPQTEGEVK